MITHKSFADASLPNSKTTAFTASAATRVTLIVLVNTDSSARTVNVYVKRSGSSSRRIIRTATSLAATGSAGDRLVVVGATAEIDHIGLSTGDIIEWDASTAAVVDGLICGGEET